MFVFLSGGPGEPGVPFLAARPQVARPGGATRCGSSPSTSAAPARDALDCPALQKEMGASDLTPPTERRGHRLRDEARRPPPVLHHRRHGRGPRGAADRAEGRQAHARRHLLRHVHRAALRTRLPEAGEGARARLGRPRRGLDACSSTTQMKATGPRPRPGDDQGDWRRSSRSRATARSCSTCSPALSVGAPRDDGYVDAIHAGRERQRHRADGAGSNGVGKAVHRWTAAQLSQGLHASTLCADWPAPWGDASAPLEGPRGRARRRRGQAHRRRHSTRSTARPRRGNGFALQCLYWPPVAGRQAGRAARPPRRPDAAAQRRPRPLDPVRVGRAGADPRARRQADRSSRAPATTSRTRATRRRWPPCGGS